MAVNSLAFVITALPTDSGNNATTHVTPSAGITSATETQVSVSAILELPGLRELLVAAAMCRLRIVHASLVTMERHAVTHVRTV